MEERVNMIEIRFNWRWIKIDWFNTMQEIEAQLNEIIELLK